MTASRFWEEMKISDFSKWIFEEKYGIINKTLPTVSAVLGNVLIHYIKKIG